MLSRMPECSSPLPEIGTLVRLVLQAGGVHLALVQQRRALDQQIERVAALRTRKA